MARSVRKYQVALLGPDLGHWRDSLLAVLKSRIEELGTKIWTNVDILEGGNVQRFDRSAPVFGIWFGSSSPADPDELTALHSLLDEIKTVQPVVRDLGNFTKDIPPRLREINGLSIDGSPHALDRLVNTVLESMQLLRRRRRIFISYARKDSEASAKQIFGTLAESGFDVFLDTHSVPASTVFQNQLWHSMVDSDLVLLLDSNGVDASHWCRQEYEKADALSIGVVRVLWPDRILNPTTDNLLLSLLVKLSPADFLSKSPNPTKADLMTEGALERVAEKVEGFRARSIAARQANLVRSFERHAARQGINAIVQPNSHIYIDKIDRRGRQRKIAVIPTVGVPVSTNFHEAFLQYSGAPPDAEAQVVLYDRQGFLPRWVDHLTWLNGSLPVKGIDIGEVPTWLSKP